MLTRRAKADVSAKVDVSYSFPHQ